MARSSTYRTCICSHLPVSRRTETVRFGGRVAGRAFLLSQPPQNRTCESPRIRLKHLPASAGPKDPFLQPSYVAFHGRPVDAGPVVEIATPACRFSAAHRLTSQAVPSAQQHRFGDTCRKSAPFRDGYCPIRPITGRRSLSPASSAPWPVSLPCGRATTRGWGPWGLPS